MQRYFMPADRFAADRVTIEGDDAHHLLRVMRAEPGDQIICSDGESREVLAKLVRLEKDRAEAEIVRELAMDREPEVQVWIAQSLPKGDKLETVLQKGTEIGAARFVPFVSERTVVQFDERKETKRLERWRKIVKEAAEQAHRSRLPQVSAPVTWGDLLKLIPRADLALFAYEKEAGTMIRDVLSRRSAAGSPPASVLVIIGPEGGFSEREAAEAEAAGAVPVGLGRRILRTETAGMVALACILYETGEMGGTDGCQL